MSKTRGRETVDARLKVMLRAIQQVKSDSGSFRALRRLIAPFVTRTTASSPAFQRGMEALKPYIHDAGVRFLLVSMSSAVKGGQSRVIQCWKKCMEANAPGEVVPEFEGPEPGSTGF